MAMGGEAGRLGSSTAHEHGHAAYVVPDLEEFIHPHEQVRGSVCRPAPERSLAITQGQQEPVGRNILRVALGCSPTLRKYFEACHLSPAAVPSRPPPAARLRPRHSFPISRGQTEIQGSLSD